MSQRLAAAAAVLMIGMLAGCAVPAGPPDSSPPPATSASPGPSPTRSPGASPSPSQPPRTPTPSPTVVYARTTHGFAIPTEERPFVTVHEVTPPVAPPPAPPLPCLEEVAAGRHPEEDPAYDQLSFRFSGGFPSYEVRYVPSLIAPGSGEEIPVPGATAILQVEFRDAQAHDESGRSCIRSSPENPIGFPAIVSSALAGDFEAAVLYGIGVGVRPRDEGPGRVRIVEVERVEGGRHVYVVAVQVTT